MRDIRATADLYRLIFKDINKVNRKIYCNLTLTRKSISGDSGDIFSLTGKLGSG